MGDPLRVEPFGYARRQFSFSLEVNRARIVCCCYLTMR